VTRYRLFDDHAILRNACLCAGFWTPGFGGADSHPPNILALPGAASGPSNSPAFKPALLTLSQPHPLVKTPPCAGKQSFADYASVLQSGSYSSKKPGCFATKAGRGSGAAARCHTVRVETMAAVVAVSKGPSSYKTGYYFSGQLSGCRRFMVGVAAASPFARGNYGDAQGSCGS
jgi:hypothetical protein